MVFSIKNTVMNWRFWIGRASAFLAAIYVITVSPFMLMKFEQQLTIFLCLILLSIFASKPMFKTGQLRRLSDPVDILLMILTVVLAFYQVAAFQDLIYVRPGMPTAMDTMMGSIMVLLVLESTRRSAGWILTILASIFLLYAFFGNLLPDSIGNRGYSLERVTSHLYLTTQGIYGIPLEILVQYVALFVAFGIILEASGAAKFLIDLSKVVAGRITGGLAQIAVVASALMGTISGTAVGNVATTGSVTIPTMKKGGYPPHVAGAVEAVASTGGQLMPPIMGAAAFLMADLLGIPYLEVAKAALLPAILYYLALFFAIYFFAKRYKLHGLVKGEIPGFLEIMKTGAYHIIPIAVLIFVLLSGRSPTMAGIIGLATAIVMSFMKKTNRMNLKKLAAAFTEAGNSLVMLAPLSATAGILIGVVSITGLGPRLSIMLIDASQGNVLFLLLLTAVASLILGMGMPTTAAYVVLATLVAPALIDMGIQPLIAHLFIFYFGMLSQITPPVALASYTAAAIAGSSPNKVGWQAFIMSFPIFIVPFFFIYSPELTLQGSLSDILRPMITSIIGTLLFSASMMGWFIKKANLLERILLAAAAILLIEATLITDIIGLVILIVVIVMQLLLRNKKVTSE